MFKLAIRNILRNKRRNIISFLLILFGFSFVFLYYAFFLGYMEQFVKNIVLNFMADIRAQKEGYIELRPYKNLMEKDFDRELSEIKSIYFSKRLLLYGMVSTAENWRNCLIIGMEPKREKYISNWFKGVYKGEYLNGEGDYVLIDKETAEKLNLDIGSRVVLMLQDKDNNIESKNFYVKGILNIAGFKNFVMLDIKKLQEITRLENRFTSYFINTKDKKMMNEIKNELLKIFDKNFSVKTWEERMPYIKSMYKLTRIVAIFYLGFIFLTAAIGILNIVYMNVSERKREIGIMRAIGMKGKDILNLILLEIFILVTISIIGGVIFSLIVYHLWQVYGLDLSAFAKGMEFIGLETKVYPSMDIYGIISSLLMAYFFGVLSGLYPAFKAGKVKPVEALREIR